MAKAENRALFLESCTRFGKKSKKQKQKNQDAEPVIGLSKLKRKMTTITARRNLTRQFLTRF